MLLGWKSNFSRAVRLFAFFLSFFFFSCGCIHAQSSNLSSPLTFRWREISLSSALNEIAKDSRLSLSYDSKILPDSVFSADFVNIPAEEILAQLLSKHNLQGVVKGNALVVQRGAPAKDRFFTISGYVEDRESSERLAGATVYDVRSKQGTLANEAGFFSLRVPDDSVKLVVSMVGFAVHVEKFKPTRDLRKIIGLAPDFELNVVEILDQNEQDGLEALSGVGVVNVPLDQLEQLPSLLGEADVYNALKLYPGVHSGGDGSSGLYVRGGGPDQNLVLLDGVPIYNSSHLFGFYSIFNADAIQSVELFKGGFPARYGGRLSSVISINMREGDPDSLNGELNVGLSAARLTLSGPIVKGKTTCVVSARRTIMEPFFSIVNRIEAKQNGNRVDYSFYDLNAKVTHRISTRDRLFITLYTGGDKFGSGYSIDTSNVADRFDFRLDWGNSAGIVRWRRDWSHRLFSDLSVFFTRYDYRAQSSNQLAYMGQDSLRSELLVTSQVQDLGLRGQIDLIPGNRNFLRMGFSSTLHQFLPETFTQLSFLNWDDTTSFQAGQDKIFSLENNLFLEENIRLGPLSLNLGLNGVLYVVDSKNYTSVQPRLSARLKLPFQFALEANFSSMVQYVHLLSNAGVGLPTDLWVPATSRIPPQKAFQAAVAIERDFKRLGIEWGIEGYLKSMTQLIDYQTGINFLGSNDWQNLVETDGVGLAYGLEWFMRKHTGRFTATVGYTLSRSTRTFPTINFGNEYLYKYDRTHDLSIAAQFDLNSRMSLSAAWVFGTGNAITFPLSVRYAPTSPLLGFWDLNEGPNLDVIIDYGERNSFRMPPYHRLDLNYNVNWKGKKVEWNLNFGVFNAYNRRNPYFLFLRADYANDPTAPEIKARKMSLLPILPSLNLGLKF